MITGVHLNGPHFVQEKTNNFDVSSLSSIMQGRVALIVRNVVVKVRYIFQYLQHFDHTITT